MAGEPAWPDWGEFITQDREHINQLRGMSQPQQPTHTQPTRMGEPDMEITETELREMARTPWHDLNAGQQRVVLAHLCGPGRSKARTALRDALNMNPTRTAMELWQIQQAAGVEPATDPATPVPAVDPADHQQAAGVEPAPVGEGDWAQQWQPGMLVDELPVDLHEPKRIVTDAQKAADKARKNPGGWVVYGATDGRHARRVALDKVRRVKRADVQAFSPAGAFDACAIEVEEDRYVVFVSLRVEAS
ncbi:MAG: hypothetical protein MR570_03295 [Bifidobacterium pseudolongum]|nr:hypothetical protein [Bifidobacterium pseudolongum]